MLLTLHLLNQRGTMDSEEKKNSRLQEIEFLISILNDLSHNYPEHNENVLEELIANLCYRRDKEEITRTAKSKSEEFMQRKQLHYTT